MQATNSSTDSAHSNLIRWLPYLLSVSLVLPSLMWLLVDRHVWGGDQAWYGEFSVDLYYTLIHQPGNWLAAIMAALGTKAPVIAWIGQFFVPLGMIGGSVDAGLMVSVLVVQAVSLVLIFRAVENLAGGRLLIPVVAAVSMASAPLFVGMSHQYFVEPHQLLAVAWFVLIMSFAPKWNRFFIVTQLAAAAAFAMLAKVSSPMYCLGPGLVALKYVFWPASEQPPFGLKQKRTVASAISAVALSVAAVVWYAQNLDTVMGHVSRSSSGPVAELFGRTDTFLNTLIYWVQAGQQSFYWPVLMGIVALVIAGGIYFFIAGQRARLTHASLCAATALAQIVLVLLIFSQSVNRETRYLLPLLPYFSILVCWALLQIDKKVVTGGVTAAFALQFLISFGQTFGIITPSPQVSHWLHPFNPDTTDAIVLDAIVTRTCTEGRHTVVGVNLPWLNYNSAAYFAAKQRLETGVTCYYSSIGFAQTDIKKAEEFVRAVNPLHIVTVDPAFHPVPNGPWNQVTEAVLKKALDSDEVYLAPPLAEDTGVLIFNRTKDKPPDQSN
jgi:hypothetical protein